MAQTFFKVVSPQEALQTLLQISPVETERIPTVRARARVLAEDLYSSVDLPHFHRAAMDGYAVRAQKGRTGFPTRAAAQGTRLGCAHGYRDFIRSGA